MGDATVSTGSNNIIGMATSLLLVAVGATAALFFRLLWRFWWRPRAIEAALRSQGIHGPPHKPLVGNMLEIMQMRSSARDYDMETSCHDLLEHVLPDYVKWSKLYGKPYVYWWLTEPRIVVSEPEMIREVLSKQAVQFGRSAIMQSGLQDIIGEGLFTVNGEKWTQHRRVVTPAFHVEKLKGMVPVMGSCFAQLADKWEQNLESQPEIEITGDLATATSDVISHTAFGSSYNKGKRVFEVLTALTEVLSLLNRYDWIPGFRLLPLPANQKFRRLRKELNSLLLGIIKERREMVERGRSDSYGIDLLGLIISQSEIEGSKSSFFNDKSLVDECNTFYLAGQETTATLLTWAMYLLALYPEWQEQARNEVLQACGTAPPDQFNYDMISKLKLVSMILNETLRLYPPASIFFRGALQDTRVGSLFIPSGAAVSFPVMALHHDPKYWGPDALEFNPLRFKEGVSKACKHPNAFMPFSFGPRICVGQAFALLEAKVGLATILQGFKFRLSPSYRHNPTGKITLKAQHGVQVIFEKATL